MSANDPKRTLVAGETIRMSPLLRCVIEYSGTRIIDIANPHILREVAYFVPDVPDGADRVQSNDVTADERGLIYLIDRLRGLTIIE